MQFSSEEHESKAADSQPSHEESITIRETFSLPKADRPVAAAMIDFGRVIEAEGGITVRPAGLRFDDYLLNSVPEVAESDGNTALTWLYATTHWSDPSIDFHHLAMRWIIHEDGEGVHVQAECKTIEFRQAFYQFIEAGRDAAYSATGTKTDDRQSSVPEPPRRSGRKTLLCNEWAAGEQLLGRTPSLDDYLALYETQQGKKREDLIDPLNAMKKGIASVLRSRKPVGQK